MTIVRYETCNHETYAVLKHDRTNETYLSTQCYTFPYTKENIKTLKNTLGASSGALILDAFSHHDVNDIHTLSVFTFTDNERNTVTAALALDNNTQKIDLKLSLDEIFPVVLYDIFEKIELDQLKKDNVLQYKDQSPYDEILKDYQQPSKYGIGLYVNGKEIEKGDRLSFSGFKAFMDNKPDDIDIVINEHGVLFGLIAGIEHVKPDGSKLTHMDIEAQKEHMTKDEWLKNAIEEDTLRFEEKYQKKVTELKTRYDLTDSNQLEQYLCAVDNQNRVKQDRLKQSIESVKTLDDDVFVANISKGQLGTLLNNLTCTNHQSK